MISHSNIVIKKSPCIYHPSIECILNFDCSSCPIGCNTNIQKSLTMCDIEDIGNSSLQPIKRKLKISNKKNKYKSKNKLDNSLKDQDILLNKKLSICSDNDNQVIINNNNNKFQSKRKELMYDVCINDSIVENNIINLITNHNQSSFSINFNLKTSKKLICFVNGKLSLVKLQDFIGYISSCLLIMFSESFIRLFNSKLQIIS